MTKHMLPAGKMALYQTDKKVLFPGKTSSTVWQHFGFNPFDDERIDKSQTVCKVCKFAEVYRNISNLQSQIDRHHKAN